MNAMNMAKTAYSASKAPTRTPRGTEYEAFAQITAKMKAAAANPKQHFAALAQALHENRRLWTLLASDVAEKGNGLPQPLRARIFYLSQFTNEHTSKVLQGEENAEILIEINTAVMRGLRTSSEAA